MHTSHLNRLFLSVCSPQRVPAVQRQSPDHTSQAQVHRKLQVCGTWHWRIRGYTDCISPNSWYTHAHTPNCSCSIGDGQKPVFLKSEEGLCYALTLSMALLCTPLLSLRARFPWWWSDSHRDIRPCLIQYARKTPVGHIISRCFPDLFKPLSFLQSKHLAGRDHQ